MSKGLFKKILFVLATILVVVGLFFFMFSGENYNTLLKLFDKNLTQDQFVQTLRDFDYRGYITFGILSMLQVLIPFLPSQPVQVLSGITYGFEIGFLVCFAGVILGNSLMFLLYKTFGEGIGKYLRKNIDVDFDKINQSGGFMLIIFLLYLCPAIPFGLLCFFVASLNMKYPRYILITTIGSIPSTLIGVALGELAVGTSWIVSLIVFAVLILFIVILTIKRKAVFAWINKIIHKNNLKQWQVKKPSRLLNVIKNPVVSILKNKVNFSYEGKEKIEGPCIVLCSHGSFLDFVYALTIMKKNRPNFIIARLYFYRKFFNKWLRAGGAFPKSMFAPDMENIKNCIKVVSNKGVLAMMPEAHLASSGHFEGIHESTIKFIKKMGVDIYGIRIQGSYFAKPKWGDSIRKGAPVDAELTKILSADQVKEISTEELYEKIKDAIYYDDFKWLDEKHPDYKYTHKTLAKGLETILYKCPECGAEYTLETSDRDIYCTKCSYKVTLNDRYAFDDERFKNFSEWYDYQTDVLKDEIVNNPEYVLEDKVVLKMRSKKGNTLVEPVGEGVCRLDRSGLTYEGSIDGETVKKFFPMSTIVMILYGAGEDFEIYEKDQIYFFVPEELKSCVKWHIASLILKDLSEQK